MTLSEYLTESGLTAEAFAERIGRNKSTVSRILRGKNRPDWETMALIERETGGAVTPNDFREPAPVQ